MAAAVVVSMDTSVKPSRGVFAKAWSVVPDQDSPSTQMGRPARVTSSISVTVPGRATEYSAQGALIVNASQWVPK